MKRIEGATISKSMTVQKPKLSVRAGEEEREEENDLKTLRMLRKVLEDREEGGRERGNALLFGRDGR